MLRSMYSGISGLKNFQTKLDVIGNNISNVNTYGFKKGRVVFKDLISQTTAGASGATLTRGGVNPKQVGLGSQIAAIDTIHGTGSLQTTSRTLDLAISGDGFFQVADGAVGTNQVSTFDGGTGTVPLDRSAFTNTSYTRAGNFYMDAEGFLVNSDGKFLVGYSGEIITDYDAATNQYTFSYLDAEMVPNLTIDPNNPGTITLNDETDLPNNNLDGDPTNETVVIDYRPIRIPTDAQSMSIGQDGSVTFVDAGGVLRWAGQIVLAKFPNTGGLEKVGSNYYNETPNSGAPLFGKATESGIGSIQSGFLEMSNVDLSEEFTEMIVAQRGFQANSRIITTSDEILQELVNLKR